MDAHCPLCEPSARGVTVQIQPKTEFDQLTRSLSRHAATDTHTITPWKRLDNQTLWLEWRYFCNLTPYLNEFYQPNEWIFFDASETPDGFDISSKRSFSSLLADIPKLWIREIIDRRQIRMMYQPLVNVHTSQVFGYEMLARGLNADESIIPPNTLFEVAREQNELFRLDRACRIAAIEAGSKLADDQMIFINFVPTSIYIPEHCLTTTLRAIRQYAIDPSRVIFEVVETDKVDDLDHLKTILQYYRSQGFRYALDDVGEGFNDLDTLAALKPDVVKLDRKYARNIHVDDEQQRRAAEVLDMAKDIGAIPLAEGIEIHAEADVLRDIGYQWQQGYLYGKPQWHPL